MGGNTRQIFTEELFEGICARIEQGESLRKIAKEEGMPKEATFLGWITHSLVEGQEGGKNTTIPDEGSRPRLRERYIRARDNQAVRYGELVVETAQEAAEEGKNSNEIQGLRLVVDAYKWTAERLAARRYGNKQEITGPDGGPLQVSVVHYGDKE